VSRYATYDGEQARVYAATRPPVGAAFVRAEVAGACSRARARPGSIRVLDAGCGTGTYLDALTGAGAGARVVAVDLSRPMLRLAVGSVPAHNGTRPVPGAQGSIEGLPVRPGAFDLVLVSQVLHHLEPGDDAGFARTRRALAELTGALGPGGRLVLCHCMEDQLAEGFWYYALIPEARARSARYCIPWRLLIDTLDELGFVVRRRHVPSEPMQGPAYFDATGPLRSAWRRTDSIWAMVSDDELAAALDRVEHLRRTGRLDRYLAHHDARRPTVGQMTFLTAERPL
jgi:SAM-dependent methyltransferase